MEIEHFKELIWQKGNELFRPMPWRDNTEPYHVLVSELMLQQTQVDRVKPKFEAFLQAFPTINDLAAASLGQVLELWSGLGYNRRAKFLHQAAQMVVQDFGGVFPTTVAELVKLPGVGVNTAGALMAYSFNQPVVYIETNIRTVYFHHFFQDQASVSDTELKELVAETVDQEHPREWYWAMMDYGSYLKRSGVRLNDQSAHYKKQPPLKGSIREIRGQILKELAKEAKTISELKSVLVVDARFEPALQALENEGLISQTDGSLHLAH